MLKTKIELVVFCKCFHPPKATWSEFPVKLDKLSRGISYYISWRLCYVTMLFYIIIIIIIIIIIYYYYYMHKHM